MTLAKRGMVEQTLVGLGRVSDGALYPVGPGDRQLVSMAHHESMTGKWAQTSYGATPAKSHPPFRIYT